MFRAAKRILNNERRMAQDSGNNSTVVDRFLAQALASPDACAVVHENRELTFRELEERSARWAEGLRARGVAPGHHVGLCLERGLNLAIGLLAILRTGAAYVPLDPSYPAARLRAMIRQAGVRLVLSDSEVLEGRDDIERIEPTDLDGAARGELPRITPQHLAYVIFTSGSTGVPKGVMLSHRALDNLIGWQLDDLGFDAPARVLQFSPSSFDMHFPECFGAWSAGGSIVMVSDDLRRDPQRLVRFIEVHGVERVYLPYVALQQLADASIKLGLFPSCLRDIVTAGEQLVASDTLREYFRGLPDCRLHNHYGPSETHVATAFALPADPGAWETLPAIGLPIRNARALIVSEEGNVITDGRDGELYLGGACVADGYVGMPQLTAERFVKMPGHEGTFYRTGDLARMDANGLLYFLGRRDGQVKIRGYRVETAEIELALNRQAGVGASAVVASGSHSGDRRLIAYLVPDLAAPHVANGSRQIEEWRTVWDNTYDGDQSRADDPEFDISGWNSSYDGEPLSADHMRRWVDGTRARILRHHPNRVLEIGAGTGLILFAVATDVSEYHAVDYSAAAIRKLRRALEQRPEIAARCTTACCAANEVSGLPGVAEAGLDTIVINSVTQHFESSEYLVRVLSDAAHLLREGGTIFVGDVTCRSTRPLHFASVEHVRGGRALAPAELLRRVARRLADDQELTVDPAWFFHLPTRVPRIDGVEVQLKPGGYDNEMSQYRFDVVLRVASSDAGAPSHATDGGSSASLARHQWSTADEQVGLTTVIGRHFAKPDAGPLRVEDIPNARLAAARALMSGLTANTDAAAMSPATGVDPDVGLDVASALGLEVQTVFSTPGCFDAVFSREPVAPHQMLRATEHSRGAESYISKPYLAALFPDLVKRVREALVADLPEYLRPARYVLLQSVPLTPSGKLDRARLPEPSTERPALAVEYVTPQTAMERTLADVWQRALELDAVGVLDNFFELGGTSILSLQVVTRMSEVLGRDLSIVSLFQHPTIRSFAASLDDGAMRNAALEASQSRARLQQQALARGRQPKRTLTS